MNKNGYILIEIIIGLFITTFISIAVISLFALSLKLNTVQDLCYEDENSIHQIRLILAISNDLYVEDEKLCFEYLNDTSCFVFINNKLIKKEGTVIYLDNVDALEFFIENEVVKVYYLKKEQQYIRTLTYIGDNNVYRN